MTLIRSLKRILLEGYPSSTCDKTRRQVKCCLGPVQDRVPCRQYMLMPCRRYMQMFAEVTSQ